MQAEPLRFRVRRETLFSLAKTFSGPPFSTDETHTRHSPRPLTVEGTINRRVPSQIVFFSPRPSIQKNHGLRSGRPETQASVKSEKN